MGVEIVNIGRRKLGGVQGGGYGSGGALAGGVRLSEVVRVAGSGVTAQFGQRLGSPGSRVVGALQDQHRRALGQHETVAAPVERLAGALGMVVLARQGAQGVESRHAQGGYGRFGAAGEDHVGAALADEFPAGSYGIGAAAAGRRDAIVRAHSPGHHGDLRGTHVGQHHGDEEGRDAPGAAFQQHLMLLGKGGQAADSAADDDVDTVTVHLAGFQIRLTAGFLGGHGGELGEPVHAPGVFPLQVIFRVEALDLRGEAGVEGFGVEAGDVVDARPAGGYGIPAIGAVKPQRADHAEARHHHLLAGGTVDGHSNGPGWGCVAGGNRARRSAFR